MKIGFIYENGFSNNNGSNHLLADVINELLVENEVFLFESKVSDDTFLKKDILNNPHFHLIDFPCPVIRKDNFIKRYLNGRKLAKRIEKETKKYPLDIYFVQSSPTVYFVYKRLLKQRKPIVYNIYDVFPGFAYELGILKFKFLDTFFKHRQRLLYKNSTRIIVMSDDMKRVIVDQGANPELIDIAHCWFDDDIEYIDSKSNPFAIRNNINLSKFIVQYAGNIGQAFDYESFTKLATELINDVNIEFHIIGDGVNLEKMKSLSPSNIKFFGWQPASVLNQIYSYPDLEIIPLRHGVIGNSVPSKPAYALGCGKKILNIVENSSYYWMFEKNCIGWSFNHNQIDEAAKLLRHLSNQKSINKVLYSENCVLFSKEYYSKKDNINIILDSLNLALFKSVEIYNKGK